MYGLPQGQMKNRTKENKHLSANCVLQIGHGFLSSGYIILLKLCQQSESVV